MKIRVKYQIITAALIASVVISITAMVIHTQRKVLREQAMQRLEALMEGAARITKEAFISRDRLMAVSYLLFLRKTYPELIFASVSYNGQVSKIGTEEVNLLYLEREIPLSSGPGLNVPPRPASLPVPGGGAVRLGFAGGNIDEQVNRALYPLIRRTAGIAGVFLFLGLLVNAWVTRLLTGPIEALAQATALLAAGHMDISVPVRSKDEMGTLTGSFNSMAGRLRALMQSREDILHTLTHEINTPLSGLKGYLELWQDEKIPHDTKTSGEIAGIMTAAVLRMENSLGSALKLFRDEGSPPQGAEEKLAAIDEVFKQTITMFLPVAAANGIKILPLRGSTKSAIMAPEEPIRRIVNNLVSNAVKYTPAGGEISMDLGETDDEVMFNVRNSGHGIPAEDIPRLFTKFYRSGRAGDKGEKIPGTGLGLNIVHKAVAALGGRVWAESRVGEYTLFCVRLPGRGKTGQRSERL